MSEPNDGPDESATAGAGGDQEPVGSVGEEAVKLLGALSEWAREQGGEYAGTATGAAGAFSQALRDVNEHISTGSEECRYCPVCQVIHVVRETSPEVRAHLGVAASSLMHAAGELLATRTAQSDQRDRGVQKIDLDPE